MQLGNGNKLRELIKRLSKGVSLNESQNGYLTGNMKPENGDKDQGQSVIPYSFKRGYNIEEWLQKHSKEYAKRSFESTSALVDLIERFMDATDLLSWQRYCVHNYEVVVSFLILDLNFST